MNAHKTGKAVEKIAYEKLLAQKYWIEKPRRAKFQPQDFFYCWDFIAVNSRHIRFIQVSTKSFSERSRADKERMLAFPKPPGAIKEYWRWDGKAQRFEMQTI